MLMPLRVLRVESSSVMNIILKHSKSKMLCGDITCADFVVEMEYHNQNSNQ